MGQAPCPLHGYVPIWQAATVQLRRVAAIRIIYLLVSHHAILITVTSHGRHGVSYSHHLDCFFPKRLHANSKWKTKVMHCWYYVRGIHSWPVESPQKGEQRGKRDHKSILIVDFYLLNWSAMIQIFQNICMYLCYFTCFYIVPASCDIYTCVSETPCIFCHLLRDGIEHITTVLHY